MKTEVNELLALNIVSGPIIVAFFALAAALLIFLLARRPTRRWQVTSAVAVLAGVVLAVVIWFIVQATGSFGIPISPTVYALLAATLAGVFVAVVNLWRSRWWRKVIAITAVPVFLVTGTLGINAEFGLNHTVGSLFGVVSEAPIALPFAAIHPRNSPKPGPLWQTWKPPANMPAQGSIGTQVIPNTISGFNSRPAGIYLPPAALVPNAPRLPLVVMMMGQPGSPDTVYTAQVLDKIAARNNGLAPIVIVADQIGNPYQDPLCLNTAKYGNVKTFINQDVVNWALANLNIIHDHKYWTIAGYSNGGACAISYLAEFPKIWSNVFDISGEEYPGSENPRHVRSSIFNGDQAAYDAIKPENMLASRKYPDTFGVFTVGSNDAGYIPGVKRMAAAAAAAGMDAVYWESPNGGHVLPALTDGLNKGYELLYPRLGLSAGPP